MERSNVGLVSSFSHVLIMFVKNIYIHNYTCDRESMQTVLHKNYEIMRKSKYTHVLTEDTKRRKFNEYWELYV
jgi:hypothetical protein